MIKLSTEQETHTKAFTLGGEEYNVKFSVLKEIRSWREPHPWGMGNACEEISDCEYSLKEILSITPDDFTYSEQHAALERRVVEWIDNELN